MNASRILLIAAVIFAVLFSSVFLGMAVGTSDFQTLAGFVAIALAITLFGVLRNNIWILIPIFAAWDGRILVLPLPLSVANIAVAFVVGCSILLLLSRSTVWRFKLSMVDFWILALLVILALGYFRNPVSVAALATGGNIGARPYFEAVMAVTAYLILANKSASVSTLRRLPICVIIGTAIIAIGGAIAFFLPNVGVYMFQFYSGFMPDMAALETKNEIESPDTIGRAGFVLGLSYALSLYLFAKQPPLLAALPTRPFSLLGLMLATALALVSGFRGAVVALGMHFIAGSYLWWRGRGLLLCAVIAITGIAGIAAIQSTVGLPYRLQRPLSFLPGAWDSHVVQSAKVSNEWRFDMWREILNGNSVKNWWIGDGFGFPASEFAYYSELQRTGEISSQQLADYYLITGDLHSGPLTALKFVGGIGLAVFIILSITVAVMSVRLWTRVKHTPLGMPVAFYTISSIYFPIKYLFIFGSFQYEFSYLIITAGILRMLQLSAKDYELTLARQNSEAVSQDAATQRFSERQASSRPRPLLS